ncbi:MAG: porin [Candidatus Puniceispirillaceae bacterium]
MRKILLASTALVALGVSAATAEFSISGNAKWTYSSWSNSNDVANASNNTFSTTNDLTISSSFASDNGLTYGTSHTIDESNNNDGQKLYVAGSFGEVRFGGDTAGAAYDTNASVADGELNKTAGSKDFVGNPTTAKGSNSAVSYFTPSINGFSAGASLSDAGDNSSQNNDVSEMGISYSQDVGDASVTISYATRDTSSTTTAANDGSSATSLGATIGYGDLTITLAQNTQKKDDSSTDETGTGVGVSYVLQEGLTLNAHTRSSDDSKNTKKDTSETAASLTYTVAPGLTANVAYTDSSFTTTTGTKTTGSATTAYLKVAF